jgi:plasmid stabilization system protein ParE
MPEIIWKQGAENDLLQIFADLEDYRQGAGERLVGKLDLTLENLKVHPSIAPILRAQCGVWSLDPAAMVYFIPLKLAGSLFMR